VITSITVTNVVLVPGAIQPSVTQLPCHCHWFWCDASTDSSGTYHGSVVPLQQIMFSYVRIMQQKSIWFTYCLFNCLCHSVFFFFFFLISSHDSIGFYSHRLCVVPYDGRTSLRPHQPCWQILYVVSQTAGHDSGIWFINCFLYLCPGVILHLQLAVHQSTVRIVRVGWWRLGIFK